MIDMIRLNDAQQLNQECIKLSQQMEVDTFGIEYCQEFCRYEDSKLHVIGALLGGVAS